MELKIVKAFLVRDFLIEKAYRLHFLVKTSSVFFQLAIFYYLGKLIGTDYFPFVFIGILFSKTFDFTISCLTDAIRQEQHWGTLESVFLSPLKQNNVTFSLFTSKLLFFLLEFIIYLLIGILVFGFNISLTNFLILFIFFSITIFSFYGLGLMNAGYVLAFKRGDPSGWLVSTLVDLLSGVYFPLNILPGWIVKISYILPTTYALSFIRKLVLEHKFSIIDLGVMVFCGIVFFISGRLCFSKAFDYCRKKGTLGTY